MQGGAVKRCPRDRPVVIAVGDEAPALVRLALYIGLAGLPLGVERVEFEIEIMLGRFSGVDRATQQLSCGLFSTGFHNLPPWGLARTEERPRRSGSGLAGNS